jgi:glutathione S-transferase
MSHLRLSVISLRYSSWSMRPWLALTHAGARFDTDTADVELGRQTQPTKDDASLAKVNADQLKERRAKGSVTGLFPVLWVDGTPVHESLAICEWVNDAFPEARLWPEDRLERARARAICMEMATGFTNMRTHLSCHLFGRAPGFRPPAAAQRDIERVFEIWDHALERSGGPFLFGRFSIADCMYYPVRTRFRTYDVALPERLAAYADALDAHPAVQKLVDVARSGPRIPAYDKYLRSVGGDPDASLQEA